MVLKKKKEKNVVTETKVIDGKEYTIRNEAGHIQVLDDDMVLCYDNQKSKKTLEKFFETFKSK